MVAGRRTPRPALMAVGAGSARSGGGGSWAVARRRDASGRRRPCAGGAVPGSPALCGVNGGRPVAWRAQTSNVASRRAVCARAEAVWSGRALARGRCGAGARACGRGAAWPSRLGTLSAVCAGARPVQGGARARGRAGAACVAGGAGGGRGRARGEEGRRAERAAERHVRAGSEGGRAERAQRRKEGERRKEKKRKEEKRKEIWEKEKEKGKRRGEREKERERKGFLPALIAASTATVGHARVVRRHSAHRAERKKEMGHRLLGIGKIPGI